MAYFEDKAKASLRAKFESDTEIGQKEAFCQGLLKKGAGGYITSPCPGGGSPDMEDHPFVILPYRFLWPLHRSAIPDHVE